MIKIKEGWVSIRVSKLRKTAPLSTEQVDWLIKVANSCKTPQQCSRWSTVLIKQRTRVCHKSANGVRISNTLTELRDLERELSAVKPIPVFSKYSATILGVAKDKYEYFQRPKLLE